MTYKRIYKIYLLFNGIKENASVVWLYTTILTFSVHVPLKMLWLENTLGSGLVPSIELGGHW